MIPEHKVNVAVGLRISMLRMPSEDILSCEDGLISNLEYYDPRMYGWAEYKQILPAERRAIEFAEKGETAEDFLERLAEKNEEVAESGKMEPLPADLGVSGLICALIEFGYSEKRTVHASFGCVTITSNTGSKTLDKKFENAPNLLPSVAGAINKDTARRLILAVKKYNELSNTPFIGLNTVHFIEGFNGFQVYARRLDHLVDFSEFLYTNRKKEDIEKYKIRPHR